MDTKTATTLKNAKIVGYLLALRQKAKKGMKVYVVVQHFTGHLVRSILANGPKEAKEIFIDKTLPEGEQLEKLANSSFEWQDIDVSPPD